MYVVSESETIQAIGPTDTSEAIALLSDGSIIIHSDFQCDAFDLLPSLYYFETPTGVKWNISGRATYKYCEG